MSNLLVVITLCTLLTFLDTAANSDQQPATNVYNVQNLYQNMCCRNDTKPRTAMEDMKAQIASLQNKLHVLESLENKIKVLETSNRQVPVLQARLQAIQAGSTPNKNPAVGFHVVLTSNQRSSGKVRFNKIINNYGNAWFSSNHTFRAPVKGLYTFTLSFLNGASSGYAHADIMLDNVILQKGYAHQNLDTGSATTVTMMNPGEHVFVKYGSGTIYGGSDDISHFVGHIISTY